MSDIEAKFTFEENDPIKATFKAYDNPPEVVVETKSYDELADKPSINDVELVGNKTLNELGIQPQGDYALASDLTDYVKNTDYATASKGGVVRQSSTYGSGITNGFLYASSKTLEGYTSASDNIFIGKATLENIKDDYVKRGLTDNTIELTDDEKTSARTWLGAVGNTDYAGNNKVGLISAQYGYGLSTTSSGHLYCNVRTLEDYNGSLVNSAFVSKGTLDNVLSQYAKIVSITQADYDALETKDANTLYLIEEE